MELRDNPVMYPTIVRRVHEGAIETIERRYEGRPALCVWWSAEHAEEHMRENFPAGEGWKAIEQDHEELALVFGLLRDLGTMELVFLEPVPGHPDLGGLFEPDTFIALLNESEDDE